MKKTLLILLVVLIQIGNSQTTANRIPLSPSKIEMQEKPTIQEDASSESELSADPSKWEGPEKENKPRSVVGTVAKVLGITALSLAAAYAGLLFVFIAAGGGGC